MNNTLATKRQLDRIKRRRTARLFAIRQDTMDNIDRETIADFRDRLEKTGLFSRSEINVRVVEFSNKLKSMGDWA